MKKNVEMHKFYFTIALLLLVAINVLTFAQKNKENLLEEKDRIEKEINLTSKLLNETKRKKNNTLSELKLLNSRIEKRTEFIDKLKQEIIELSVEIEYNKKRIKDYNKKIETEKEEYGELIYYAFKNNNKEMNFMYLLASKDVNQFYSRYKYLDQYKNYRKKQIVIIKELRRQLALIIEENKQQLVKKEEIIANLKEEKITLKSEIASTDEIIKKLQSKEQELKEELRQKKRLAEKLDRKIEDLIRKEAKKRKYAKLTPEERIVSDDFEKNLGKLPWPTQQGVIVEKFGENPHPILRGVKVVNNGINISTVANAEVRSIFKGKVSKVFTIKGANTTVILKHGKYYTVYHNLIDVKVKAGSMVDIKETLGKVYTNNENNESIIHLEIWRELEKLNPETWLSR